MLYHIESLRVVIRITFGNSKKNFPNVKKTFPHVVKFFIFRLFRAANKASEQSYFKRLQKPKLNRMNLVLFE